MSRIATLFLMVVVLGPACGLLGQQNKAQIKFGETTYNFGTLKESEGIASHTFTFTNAGDLPLIINRATSTCGCAVLSWSEEPVVPGMQGMIRVDYDPKDRPGAFTHTVEVSTNAETPVVNLIIRGVVIPVDLVEEVYKYSLGDLRFETVYAAFGEIYKGSASKQYIRMYNASPDSALRIGLTGLPEHIRVSVEPEILEPLQEGIIEMEYLSGRLDDWDFVVDRLDISINDKVMAGGQIYATAIIREDFSKMTAADLSRAPVVGFDSVTFNFGNIGQDSVVIHDFVLSNLGKDDLYIRKISASCGCTAVQPEDKRIGSGDSTRITAVFNPAGQDGNQKKAITVITNDPKRYKTILWIEGFVSNGPISTH